MPTVIEELVIALGIDSKKGRDELGRFQKQSESTALKAARQFETMAKTGAKAFAKVGLGAAGAAAGIFKLVDSQTKNLDAVAKQARAAALSTREYQRMAFAAERSGTSIEQVSKSARFLEKSLDDARVSAASPAARAFQELGLSLDAFDGKSFEERLGIVADASRKVGDEQKRTLLISQVLGMRGGPQLATLLKSGSAGLRDLGDEAERMGLVFEEEALTAAEEFQDKLTDVKSQASAAATTVAMELLPAVQDSIPAVMDMAKGAGEAAVSMVQLAEGVGGPTTGTVAALGALAVALGGLPGLFAAAAAAGVLAGNQIMDALQPVENRIDFLRAEERRLRGEEASLKKGTDAAAELDRRSSSGTLGDLTNEQMDRLVAEAQVHGGLSAGTVAELDRQRAEQVNLKQNEAAFLAPLINSEAKQFIAAGKPVRGKSKGGGGGGPGRQAFAAIQESGLETEIRRLGESVGATAKAVDASLRAAASSIASGASAKVARSAGLGQLGSLTGADFSGRSNTDPLLAELFGSDALPSAPVSELKQGQEPQVLLSTINNNFDLHIENNIDGSREPVAVADSVVARFREMFENEIAATSKLAKVNFAR